jgi:hypothetical protein
MSRKVDRSIPSIGPEGRPLSRVDRPDRGAADVSEHHAPDAAPSRLPRHRDSADVATDTLREANRAIPSSRVAEHQVAVLVLCLRAFGGSPAIPVVVMSYFVGMLANTLPVPGGIGTVAGGMIGALIGFGVEPGLAIVGMLSYRLFAFGFRSPRA